METPDYFGLKHGSSARVQRPRPLTADEALAEPNAPARWKLPVGLFLVGVSWMVGLLLGAPVLGRSVDTLLLAVGFIGVVTGVLTARTGWAAHSRRVRYALVAAVLVITVSSSWGSRISVVIDGRPLPAFTEAGQAYAEASSMLSDLDRLNSYAQLLELSDEEASTSFWRIEEAAKVSEEIEVRWANSDGRSPQWAAASDAVRSSGYWMVEALRAKRDMILEPSAGRGEQLVAAVVNFRQAAMAAESNILVAAALPPLSADPQDFPRSP